MINVLLALIGLAAGVFTAGGLMAVITMVGVFTRYAKVSKTENMMWFYEKIIILGSFAGCVLSLYDFRFHLNFTLAMVIFVVLGLTFGIFVGCLVVCIGETSRALPIYIRRVGIGKGLGVVVIAMAVGKCVGDLIYYLLL